MLHADGDEYTVTPFAAAAIDVTDTLYNPDGVK